MAFSTVLSISTLCLACVLVASAANVPVFLSVDKTDVPLGQEFNLTCQFPLNKTNFKEAQFLYDGNALFTFTTSTSGKQDGVTGYTGHLVENAFDNSTVSATIKASLCEITAKDRKYECKVTNVDDETGTDEQAVKISGDASSESCSTATPPADAAGSSNVTTAAPSGNNNATTTESPDNIGLYGSAIALIIILVFIALLGLVGLWYLYLVKQGRANENIK